MGPWCFWSRKHDRDTISKFSSGRICTTLVVPEREMSGGNVYNYWHDVRLVIPRTSCQTSLSLCHVMTNASAVSQSVTSSDVVTGDWWGSACAAFQCNIPLTWMVFKPEWKGEVGMSVTYDFPSIILTGRWDFTRGKCGECVVSRGLGWHVLHGHNNGAWTTGGRELAVR